MAKLIEIDCFRCKELFGLEEGTYRQLLRSHANFCCPWGHSQHFVEGESEETKLRRERDRLKQDAARLEEIAARERRYREAAERSGSAFRGVATRLKNQAAAGQCPCCGKTFNNLVWHMQAKHPDLASTEVTEEG